jgi:hypothetical protein
VRTLGLGPTPQDIGIAGLKCYPSTRFQMEVLVRKTAEQHIVELKEQMKSRKRKCMQRKGKTLWKSCHVMVLIHATMWYNTIIIHQLFILAS